MSHAKHRPKRHSNSSPSQEKGRPLEPLFLNVYDEHIPTEMDEQSAETLHHTLAAWTTYIDRLSSPKSMDTDTTLCVTHARLRRGIAYWLLDEWQNAIADFSWIIERHGGDAETNTAFFYRACVYDASGQYEASMQDWTYVLTAIEHASLQPERFPKQLPAQGYAFRARLHCRDEHYKQAIADCDRALDYDSTCAEAYSVRGRAYANLKEWSIALSDCTKAIELEGWPVHSYRRGLVYREIGSYKEALADFEQAYQREPENSVFKKEYAESFMLCLILGIVTPLSSGVNLPPTTGTFS